MTAVLSPDFRDISSTFIDADVEFLVVGNYAMAAHRLPRATKDLDLWVGPSAAYAVRVLRALDAFGAPRHGLTAADLELAGTIYQVGVPPNRVDVITTLDGVPFDEASHSRVHVEIDGLCVPVIGRQQLIANKRTVGRPQDLVDAELLAAMERSSRTPTSAGRCGRRRRPSSPAGCFAAP